MILLTGGAGYIGSHTAVELLQSNYEVVILDNLSNSSLESIRRVEAITQRTVHFVEGDIRHRKTLDELFSKYPITAVIHFAGLKAVGESIEQPLEYYENNVFGSIVLLQAMLEANVKRLVFSSSATVYGEHAPVPYKELMPTGQTSNPYGASKAMVEHVLTDVQKAQPDLSVTILRYFNPVGAHSSGLIGEDPQGVPSNLMPFISQVAVGRLAKLTVYGNDYETRDGTCERDYIHVMDLANGHLCALKGVTAPGVHIFNLGTGYSTSVQEMIDAFQSVNGVEVPYEVGNRRSGDLPACWACTDKAKSELKWTAQRTLQDMVRDTWQWQQKNPQGYKSNG